jgi:hypothetical protein
MLRDTSTRHGWSPTDMSLDRIWPVAGWRAPRYLLATLVMIPITLVLGTLLLSTELDVAVLTGVAVMAVVAFALVRHVARPTLDSPVRFDLAEIRTRRRRRRLATGLIVGLTFGLAVGCLVGFGYGLPAGLSVGLLVGLTIGLTIGKAGAFTGEISAIDRPSTLLRQSLSFELMRWLAYGRAFGLPVALFGLIVDTRWPRYWIAVALGRLQGVMPARPARFLDWAYGAGLLRISGAAVQFRHREFQDWLANHPQVP